MTIVKPNYLKIPAKNKETKTVDLDLNSLYFQVGVWNEKTGVNFTRNFTESYSEIVESLQNKTLVVTTIYVRMFLLT